MKICSKCKIEKPLTSYSKNKSRKDGVQTFCKECNKSFCANKYATCNLHRKRILDNNNRMYKANSQFVRRVKRLYGCYFCGEKEPVSLDFHHLDPREKDKNIHSLYKYSRSALKRELRKCMLVCSNCHRKIHAGILKVSRGGSQAGKAPNF